MTTVQKIYDSIDKIAPFSSAMEFDNVGIQVGIGETPVRRVLLALDITETVVAEAIALGAQLIVAHHPPIFHPLKSIADSSVVYKLIQAGISAIACHTNLDLSESFGVNRALSNLLGAENFRKSEELPLFLGELPQKMDSKALAVHVKNSIGAEKTCYTGGGSDILTVAFCSGAGGEYIYGLSGKADALITGEARHDEWIEAQRLGITLIAAGHYETEKPFGALLKSYLEQEHRDLEFLLSQAETNPVFTL